MAYEKFGMVSIIMAAYNAEKTIEQAITSVLNQTYSKFVLLTPHLKLNMVSFQENQEVHRSGTVEYYIIRCG